MRNSSTKNKMIENVVSDVFTSSILLLVWYYTLKQTTDNSEKRLSWIMTLLCSLVCCFGCISTMLKAWSFGWTTEIMYGNDRISQGLIRFFISYLVLDIVIMFRDYPSIGGIYHHLPYLMFMALSLYYSCPSIFVIFFPLELSTIFLACGTIWPKYRQDFLFGVSFFLTRIVYHIVLWWQLFLSKDEAPFLAYPFAILPWFMHVFWFSIWLQKRIMPSKRPRSNKEKFS